MISFFVLPLVTIVASLCGTVAGFGIATVLLPVTLLFLSLHHALIFTGCIHWFVSLWRVIFFRKHVHIPTLLVFGVPAVLASVIGAMLTFYVDRTLFARLFGVFLILYTGFVFMQPTFKIQKNTALLSFGGVMAGFSAGLFGIRGAITSFFLTLFDLKKTVYLATISSIALCVDTSRLAVYLSKETTWDMQLIYLVALSIPCTFIGTFLGRYIVKLIPQYYFRLVVVGFLCLLGIRLVVFG